MTEYTAYFDASGKPHDPTVFVVAGFVGSERKWLRFEREWGAFLKEWGIPQPFHTTEYIRAHGSGSYGQFFKANDLRDKFEDRAVKIIRRGINKPFSVALYLDEYRGVLSDYVLEAEQGHFEHPYSLCSIHNMLGVENWFRKRGMPHERLEYIWEQGDDDSQFLEREFLRLFGEKPIFRCKQKHPQFQAADILAWVHARRLKWHKGDVDDARFPFSTIMMEWPHHSCVIVEGDALREHFDNWGLKRRV